LIGRLGNRASAMRQHTKSSGSGGTKYNNCRRTYFWPTNWNKLWNDLAIGSENMTATRIANIGDIPLFYKFGQHNYNI